MTLVRLSVLHQGLEDGGHVREAERHHKVLSVPRGCVERLLSFVSLLNPDQVVGVPEIHFSEDRRPL